MSTWQELVDDLRDMLGSLYDPLAKAPASLAALLGAQADDARAISALLHKEIDAMAPGPEVPRDTRAWRLYELLRLRYVEHLTQDDAALRLAITVRHLGREQTAAIELLAQRLCAHAAQNHLLQDSPPAKDSGWADSQLGAEVSALESYARDRSAPVASIVRRVLELLEGWCNQHGVVVTLDPGPEDAFVAVHPSLLYQILVAVVSYVTRAAGRGEVHIAIEDSPGEVLVRAMLSMGEMVEPESGWLAGELVSSHGGAVQVSNDAAGAELLVTLPSARSKVVLVLDDNEDLAHFYRLCLTGTVYRMAHIAEGSRIFDAIAAFEPQIIVLDLMLPDVDGWELLAELHERPASRRIPVIVCSVVRDEELALALGASAVVNKPVRRQQLLAALEAAANQAPS